MFYEEATMKKILVIEKYLDKTVGIETVCERLKCSKRSAYRKIAKYKGKWPPWLIHGLKWRTSNNKTHKWDWLEKYASQKSYQWFWPTLFAEKMEEVTGYSIPIETVRRKMTERWYRLPKQHKVVIERTSRKRRSSYGIMVQFDGSYHDRLENGETRCLLIAVDDATGDIIEWMFTQSERLIDIIAFWERYFCKHGKPAAIYLDRHASYKVNYPKDQFDEETLTRFKRAMNYLWVEVIYAKSPQWKWRVENKFKLLQDRAIKEFRLAEIKDYTTAEDYLINTIIPHLNNKFSVVAEKPWDFHVSMSNKDKEYFERYFAKVSSRVINRIWIIEYKNVKYQVPVWQELSWTRSVRVLESHLWNIQFRSWDILLPCLPLFA